MSRQPDQIKDGRPPFIMIEEAVIRKHKLTAHEIAAYVVLVMHANHKDGDKAFPSHKTIGEMSGMSARQARRSVDALAEKKLISITHVFDDKTKAQKSNIYTILPVTPMATQATPHGRIVQGRRTDGPPPMATQANKPDEVNQIKEKIVAATPPTLALEPKAEKKSPLRSEGKPYPVYDALESRGWGIPFNDTAPRMWTQPIGVIAKWLTCEVWTFQKQPLGKNEIPATAQDVFAFYDWWARNNPKATPPRNVFKFIEHWREWKAAVAKSTASGLHIFKSAEAS
jgi:hypothetical protein